MSSRVGEFLKTATDKVTKVASFRLRNTYAVDGNDALSILIHPSCYETELRPREESLVFLLLPPATLIDPRYLNPSSLLLGASLHNSSPIISDPHIFYWQPPRSTAILIQTTSISNKRHTQGSLPWQIKILQP